MRTRPQQLAGRTPPQESYKPGNYTVRQTHHPLSSQMKCGLNSSLRKWNSGQGRKHSGSLWNRVSFKSWKKRKTQKTKTSSKVNSTGHSALTQPGYEEANGLGGTLVSMFHGLSHQRRSNPEIRGDRTCCQLCLGNTFSGKALFFFDQMLLCVLKAGNCQYFQSWQSTTSAQPNPQQSRWSLQCSHKSSAHSSVLLHGTSLHGVEQWAFRVRLTISESRGKAAKTCLWRVAVSKAFKWDNVFLEPVFQSWSFLRQFKSSSIHLL